jgi:hypothetical protein
MVCGFKSKVGIYSEGLDEWKETMDDKWLTVPVKISKRKNVGIDQLVSRWSQYNNKRKREKKEGKREEGKFSLLRE